MTPIFPAPFDPPVPPQLAPQPFVLPPASSFVPIIGDGVKEPATVQVAMSSDSSHTEKGSLEGPALHVSVEDHEVETAEVDRLKRLERDQSALTAVASKAVVLLNLISVGISTFGRDGSKLTSIRASSPGWRIVKLAPITFILLSAIISFTLLPSIPADATSPIITLRRELGKIWSGGWGGWVRPKVVAGKLVVPYRWLLLLMGFIVGTTLWTIAQLLWA